MHQTYKGHEITVSSVEVCANEWDLLISVIWLDHHGLATNLSFKLPQQFATFDEAVAHGQVWAKDWIDNGKPYIPALVY